MARKLMHVIQYDRCGNGPASLKHVEVPVPTPKKDGVLVKVEATGVNPIDWKIQKGMLRPILPGKLPFMPGTDIAGVIIEVGSQVKDLQVCDKVVAKLSHEHGGGLANFAVSSGSLTVARPSEVSAAEDSALPLPGLTAHQVLTEIAGVKLDGTGEQKNILVTAASGDTV